MPVYEYTCEECSNCYEALVREADAEGRVTCPKCGSTRKRRLLSVFAAASGGHITSAGGGGCSSCGQSSCGSCSHR
ncbi:MAG: zinc ribbon domain-containing protein [Candidatus Coatesbacteria bacterium]|nr:MAG: zinc ribbon domain-containing protein [Candidatus Coatesbacteria bacterium]